MPPKRKKSVRQKQKQSQRQSVVVNIGKTTTRRRKRTGRGGLPPPSHQQNLFPPTIIQQQANLGNLENEISRLTAFIQARQPINNLVTPLSSSVNFQPSMPGIKAEERRAGPTASNFQPPPSNSDEQFSQNLQDELDVQSRVDFDLKQSQRQPEAEVPFAVVEKEGELLPLSFGTPKPGRPFKNPSSLTTAEPIGPPIADANQTVNLATGETLPSDVKNFAKGFTKLSQFKTEVKGKVAPPERKKSTKEFTPITDEQLRELKQLRKRASSLTPEEEKTKAKLKELAIRSGRVVIKKAPPQTAAAPVRRSSIDDIFASESD